MTVLDARRRTPPHGDPVMPPAPAFTIDRYGSRFAFDGDVWTVTPPCNAPTGAGPCALDGGHDGEHEPARRLTFEVRR